MVTGGSFIKMIIFNNYSDFHLFIETFEEIYTNSWFIGNNFNNFFSECMIVFYGIRIISISYHDEDQNLCGSVFYSAAYVSIIYKSVNLI